jgi:hypothetical protein
MSLITENKKTEMMQSILTQRYAYDFLILDENGKSFRAIIKLQQLLLLFQSDLPSQLYFAEHNGWLIILKES